MKKTILHAAMFTPAPGGRWGLPLLIEDEPGVGKTAVIEQYAAEWGFHAEILSPGERGEGAFGVVPVPVKGKLTYPAPDWVELVEECGIVFVDEVTSSPPALQAPLLGLIAARRIGSHQLGPRVRVIGACNPPEQAANGYDLAPPLANRFGHVAWGRPTVEEHAAYMMGQAQGLVAEVRNALAEEARVLKAWPNAYARAVGLEVAFLQTHPDMKNRCPKPGDPQTSRAWPSDRTWDYATRALAAAEIHKLEDAEMEDYVRAFVGPVAFEAFGTFIEQADLPRPSDVLDGKVKFEWEKKRLDRSAAIIASCAALVVPTQCEKRLERAAVLWQMLEGASAFDITVPAAQALVRAGLHVGKEALPTLAKLHPALKAAGISTGTVL